MIDYENMDITELRKNLEKLKDNIEEIEEERKFVLGQTGYHIQGGTVKQYEAELDMINKRILEIEDIIKRKDK